MTMADRYFELDDDVHAPGRWHLGNPVDGRGRELDDPWQFRSGKPVVVKERLTVPIEGAGRPLDYTLAGLSIPVVHVKAATVFVELAPQDVQLIPVDIPGQPDQYLILVATHVIRCIDEQASRVQIWAPEDGLPHKVGQYASVRDLRIDKAKVGGAKVFRLGGWEGTLIVAGSIKDSLERAAVTGVRLEEV